MILEEHLVGVEQHLGRFPKKIVADAGYGSEENDAYLDNHQLGNFVEYNTFHREQIHHHKPERTRQKMFRNESFPYDEEKDEFICPAEKRLNYRYTRSYQSDHCQSYPLKVECIRAKGNRWIQRSFRLRQFRAWDCSNLLSEQR